MSRTFGTYKDGKLHRRPADWLWNIHRAITVAFIEAASGVGYTVANSLAGAVDALRVRSGYYYRAPHCVCPHDEECWLGNWRKYWESRE